MSAVLKVYSDRSHVEGYPSSLYCDIVRAHWNDMTPAARLEHFKARYTQFTLVESIDDADFCAMPMYWAFYTRYKKRHLADALAWQARAAGKIVVVWDNGDRSLPVPYDNALVLRESMYRSRRQPNEFAMPGFTEDYVDLYLDGEAVYRAKQAKPVVGFCGQAGGSPWKLLMWGGRTLVRNLAHYVNLYPYEPVPIIPPTILRARAMRRLAASPDVQTDFVIRQQYWAGVDHASDRRDPYHPSKLEFVNNLRDTDYTLSLRGDGNFSKRFYETLSIGRIPVFVDTDCVLPFDFEINWRDYCVWVDRSEIDHIADKVAAFHAALSEEAFVEKQRACRQLWVDYLSLNGFYSRFGTLLERAKTRI
jgi:hypothetical protein